MRGGNPPHRVANVVSDKQRAFPVDRNTDRPSHGIAIWPRESLENVERLTRRLAVRERNKDHLVTAPRRSIP